MTAIAVRGAPRAQGYAQGSALRGDIRATLARSRQALGWAQWIRALLAARSGAGRAIARFLPQQHERLEGLAHGAGVPLAALVWLESSERCTARVAASGGTLALAPPSPAGWIVRASDPDAGGLASVELAAPAFGGCLAGVNRAGVAVACAGDAACLRLLAQDVLLRAGSLDGAVEHVRRRARYLRQDGTLLAVGAGARPLELVLCAGQLEVRESTSTPGVTSSSLAIDASAPRLEWRGERYAP